MYAIISMHTYGIISAQKYAYPCMFVQKVEYILLHVMYLYMRANCMYTDRMHVTAYKQ